LAAAAVCDSAPDSVRDVEQACRAHAAAHAHRHHRVAHAAPAAFDRRMPPPSAVLTFLKGVKESNALDGDAVMKQIRGMKIDDMFARNAYLREDGRLVHDMYLVEVKKPSESKARWDCYKILCPIPGENAFRPLNQGGCPPVAAK